MARFNRVLLVATLGLSSMAFLPGCAAEVHPKDVPSAASLSSEGTGRLAFTAPTAGTAYVYDNTNDKMIYSGPLTAGQRLSIDPKNDRVDIGDRKVSEQTLHTGNNYRIYFDSTHAPVTEHRVVEERTEIHQR
jgi:hypothetical protein